MSSFRFCSLYVKMLSTNGKGGLLSIYVVAINSVEKIYYMFVY